MKNKLNGILVDSIMRQDPYLEKPIDLSQGSESKLYSEEGQLDSLSLITIISDIEKQLSLQFNIKLQLANERDLSIDKSPFSTFGNMLDFIEGQVNKSVSENKKNL